MNLLSHRIRGAYVRSFAAGLLIRGFYREKGFVSIDEMKNRLRTIR